MPQASIFLAAGILFLLSIPLAIIMYKMIMHLNKNYPSVVKEVKPQVFKYGVITGLLIFTNKMILDEKMARYQFYYRIIYGIALIIALFGIVFGL